MSDHSRRYTTEHWDHERDLRKHDPRPGDRDYVPLCAHAAPISTALDIALLVKEVPNVGAAAALIQRYADMVASGARLDEAAKLGDRLIRSIEAPLSREVP